LRRISPTIETLGHINANGNATVQGDLAEAGAVASFFGGQTIPITTIKGHCGNLGAGSGAIELIAGILALEKNQLFPVLNYQTPDPRCPIRPVVGSAVPSGDSFLKLAYNSQGQASAVYVKRFDRG